MIIIYQIKSWEKLDDLKLIRFYKKIELRSKALNFRVYYRNIVLQADSMRDVDLFEL